MTALSILAFVVVFIGTLPMLYAVPMVAVNLWRRDWRMAAWCAAAVAVYLAAAMILRGAPIDIVGS